MGWGDRPQNSNKRTDTYLIQVFQDGMWRTVEEAPWNKLTQRCKAYRKAHDKAYRAINTSQGGKVVVECPIA